MVQRTRLWLGLGLFATAAGLPERALAAAAPPAARGGNHGEGEGEGEGEHGAHAGADLVGDDAAFLGALCVIEGHLLVASELYAAGLRDDARPHVKHPEDEIYGHLRPALAARRIPGFGDTLTAMAREAETGAPPERMRAAFAAVQRELVRVRGAVAAPPAVTLAAVAGVVETAGDEYDEGVEDGRVVNRKEYHDAYGFVRAARAWVAGLDPATRARHAAAMGRIEAALDGLTPAWPSLAAREVPAPFGSDRFDAAAAAIAAEARDLR